MWGGITFEIAIALTFWAFCFVCGLCIAAGIISRAVERILQHSREDEADDFADGDMPHLAPDVLTSFHSTAIAQTEEPTHVRQ